MSPVETAAPRASGSAQASSRPRAEAGNASAPVLAGGRAWIACGLLLFVFAIYALSSPGRIDIIDGQARFDVAFNWVLNGRPLITDGWIPFTGVPGRGGLHYSYYGAPASAFAIPLVWMGLYSNTSEFLFTLVSPLFGAAIASFLFLLCLELGLDRRRALGWTMVSGFATYVWAISNSSFDNAQHAFFTVAAIYCAVLSARRRSAWYAALGGLLAGVLFMYQQYFLLIVPALAIATLEGRLFSAHGRVSEPQRVERRLAKTADFLRRAWRRPGEERSGLLRYCTFLATVSVGIALSLLYNHMRFGTWLQDGKIHTVTTNKYLWGNPLAGLLTLLVSPGKSVFLYSPTLVLGVLGMRRLARRRPELATSIIATSVLLIAFLSFIRFAGGDWCWGPRYLTPLLPLWALAFPFCVEGVGRRKLVSALVAASFFVQLLALSVETQRFFFEHAFHDYFWAEDSWVYFKHSAWFSRFHEAMTLPQGPPATADKFNSIPQPDRTTYAPLGTPNGVPRSLAPVWMRQYKVFYLPRPWPFWVASLDPDLRPITLSAWLIGLLSAAGLGVCVIRRGMQSPELR